MSFLWWVLYSPRKKTVNLVARALILTVLLLVPPLGYFVWLQPVTAAGILFPHTGFWGLGLTVALIALLVSLITTRKAIWLIVLCLAGALILNLRYVPPSPPEGWVAVNTALGKMKSSFIALPLRQVPLIDAANAALTRGAKVILFPENVSADWLMSSQLQWNATLQNAIHDKADIVLGAQIDEHQGFDNVFILFGQDGYQVHPARQPMPLGLWRPWSQATYHTHWFNSGKMTVQDQTVAYILCYEQMIPFPLLYSFLKSPRPTVIVSGANQWFARPSGYVKQQNVLLANARLFGVPVLIAVNR